MTLASKIGAAALAIAALGNAWASAQEGTKDEPFEIKRLIIGQTLRIDKAFAEANKVPEPTPFQITVPTGEDFLTLFDAKQGGFVKITFASAERKFLESVHFVDMEIPAGLDDKRMPAVAKLMSEHVFQGVTKDREDPKILAIREAEIGGLAAVEVIGRYTDETEGLIYVWIVGLPHPVQSRGTYAIAMLHHARRPIRTDEDFRETLAGRALYSFRYVE